MKKFFPLIKNLMGAYLNQDYDYICETDSIEGAMDYYISDCPAGVLAELIDEFELFLSNYPDNPDKAFEEIFSSRNHYYGYTGILRSLYSQNHRGW